MRFTLRDLFWLTLLAAAVCGQWLTYRSAMQFKAERDAAEKAWADMQTDDPFGGKPAVTPPGVDPFAAPQAVTYPPSGAGP